MPFAAPGLVRLKFNGGGLAAFQKSSLPSADTSKALYLQYLEGFQISFSASLRGKCFSPHFPQTENGRGFDSRLHIRRDDIIRPSLQYHLVIKDRAVFICRKHS